MDGRVEQLHEKLGRLLKEAAEVSAEIQKLDGSQSEGRIIQKSKTSPIRRVSSSRG